MVKGSQKAGENRMETTSTRTKWTARGARWCSIAHPRLAVGTSSDSWRVKHAALLCALGSAPVLWGGVPSARLRQDCASTAARRHGRRTDTVRAEATRAERRTMVVGAIFTVGRTLLGAGRREQNRERAVDLQAGEKRNDPEEPHLARTA